MGLRGAASIVFAMMAFTSADNLSYDLFSLVFCIVLISVSLQGSLIPWVAGKLNMLDAGENVMKTFNDYSENTEMQFGSIDITPGGAWDGLKVMELRLPRNVLLALVLREGERIIPRGDTLLQGGDKVILVTKAYEDSSTYLVEKKLKHHSKRVGHPISDFASDGLILLVRRADESIIPSGNTVLQEGDRLVIMKGDLR